MGPLEERPEPKNVGRLFLAEDEQLLFIDVGTAWLQVTTDTLPWDNISDKPKVFPPATHNHDALYEPKDGNIQEHIKDKLSNPHNVTKAQVGLGNVDNTSDLDKPISTAVQQALDTKVDNSRVLTDVPANAKFTDTIYTHPETHPASMIEGLATVATSGDYNDLKNTPAPYVHPATHPASMITGLATVATSGKYSDLSEKPNLLALGTTSTTAYRGDHGLIAYNHSQSPHAPSNAEPNRPIATQAQAEEGTNNTTVMTPLRVRQAIEAYTEVIDGGTFT